MRKKHGNAGGVKGRWLPRERNTLFMAFSGSMQVRRNWSYVELLDFMAHTGGDSDRSLMSRSWTPTSQTIKEWLSLRHLFSVHVFGATQGKNDIARKIADQREGGCLGAHERPGDDYFFPQSRPEFTLHQPQYPPNHRQIAADPTTSRAPCREKDHIKLSRRLAALFSSLSGIPATLFGEGQVKRTPAIPNAFEIRDKRDPPPLGAR
ncbi:hypothetical protein LshimejAT787_0207610 [Lyophyllum shimeji]|uniref:Uncharacterized protein n=1 Tax=Lyophyllum shimeji TaxID=47721 RepID=A0A9P3PG22_LYOSH|nr:hypothetical protein LshimejAT787_0207610 [Lyophyllum shimeji]